MRNYFNYWYKRTLKDGYKAIKAVVGCGIAYILGISVNIPLGILFFVWVIMDALIEKN